MMGGQQERVQYGFKECAIAFFKEASTEAAPEWETPIKIEGAVKLSMSPESEEVDFYADNRLYFHAVTTSGEKGELEMALIPDWLMAKMFGWRIDKNGLLVQTANGTARPFALLGQIENDVKSRRFVYYNCSAGAPSVEYTTNEKGIKVNTAKFPITATAVTISDEPVVKMSVPYGKDVKDIYDGWYDAVYIPDLTEKSIYEMTVAELKAYAEAHDIDITGLTLKADILAAIEAAQA